MKSPFRLILAALCLLTVIDPVIAAETRPKEVSNFALIDQKGDMYELRRLSARVVVLFFTANGCPIARQNASRLEALRQKFEREGVEVFMVNSSGGDDRASIGKEMAELNLPNFRVLKDDTQGLARHLGVKRTAEAVAISTKDWSIFYRGAVDDRLAEGVQKPAAAHNFLEDALTEHLAGKDITVSASPTHGCIITYDAGDRPDSTPVSYAGEVAPILAAKCVHCHSAGNIGSWNMTGHRKVKGMASMIEEVILTRRMPPWDADPTIGKFQHVPALTLPEAQTLLRWVHQGAPRGEGDDPLEQLARNAKPRPDWELGQPDFIARMDRAQEVPATGVIDYRNIEVAVNNPTDIWIGGITIRPGNLKVVHHIVIRVIDETAKERGGTFFGTWSPGITQFKFPANSGKFLPAHAKLDFEMHYTTNGSPQTDVSEVGIYLLKEKPLYLYETIAVMDRNFTIPPGEANARMHAEYAFPKEVVLHGVKPHMHLRGKSMKFEMMYPDGKRETIASVPRFDFNWQMVYRLAEPKRIPAGSWALVTGAFDNSAANPANPNPKATVYYGRQTFEEMFLGWMYVTRPVEASGHVARAE